MEAHKELDTRGLNCPLPILKAKKALADWLRTRGIEPQYMELPPGKRATEVDVD